MTASNGFDPNVIPKFSDPAKAHEFVLDYVHRLVFTTHAKPEDVWLVVKTSVGPNLGLTVDPATLMAWYEEALSPGWAHARSERAGTAPTPSPRPRPRITKIDQITPSPVRWLWRGWLPVGEVVLIDGLAAMSKSTIVLDWMARLTQGETMPDSVSIHLNAAGLPAPVEALIITNEDDPASVIKPRFDVAGGAMDRVSIWQSEFAMPTDDAALRTVLAAAPDIRVVFIDPLFSHIDEGINSNSDTEIRRLVMDPLARIAKDTGTVILVARHWNKRAGDTIELRGSGSYGGITGRARVVISVTEDPDSNPDDPQPTRLIGPSKVSYGRMPKALRFHVESIVPDLAGFTAEDDAPMIAWEGVSPYDIRTAQAINDQKRTENRTDRIDRRVRAVLAAGALPAVEVLRVLKGEGFGEKAIEAATNRVGVVKVKSGFAKAPWMWSLPKPADPRLGLDEEDETP